MDLVDERLSKDTQEQLLALLCYSDQHGSEVASVLDPEMFDSIYRTIATSVYRYRSQYKGKSPGFKNMPTLIASLPVRDEQVNAANDFHKKMKHDYKGINPEFMVSVAAAFARRQYYRANVYKAGEELMKQEVNLTEVERLIHSMAKFQPRSVDLGMRLNDKRALSFLDQKEEGLKLGIEPFDRRGLRMRPGTMLLYLAYKNSGKSWFCTHLARMAALQNTNVLHVTLEMSEEQVMMRYIQCLFGLQQYSVPMLRPSFIKHNGRASNWQTKMVEAELFDKNNPKLGRKTLDNPKARRVLQEKMTKFEHMTERIVVKGFPSGTMTMSMLENYLDQLSYNENFQPGMIIVDYPDLMKMSGGKDYRISIGENFVALRGLGQERHCAMVCPSQVNREGGTKHTVTSSNAAEDISKVFTADTVITYSQKRTEKQNYLARLLLNHSRDTEVGLEVAITQSYATGQYVLNAMLMGADYQARITGKEETEGKNKPKDGELV